MRVHYDREADVLFIRFSEIVDYAEDNRVVALEIHRGFSEGEIREAKAWKKKF